MSTESKFLIGIGILTLLVVVAGVFFFSKKSQPETQPADQNALVASARHTLGNPDAPVKIVEFADMQCPACAQARPIVEKVVKENEGKAYFVFKHFPLPSHINARSAAQAAEAAGEQGKFWEMHDLIYERQAEWSNSGSPNEIFEKYAAELSLDVEKFKEDSKKFLDIINTEAAEGDKYGVDSTPTFFINGQKYPGVIPEDQLRTLVQGNQ